MEPHVCSNCGEKIETFTPYCPHCGASLIPKPQQRLLAGETWLDMFVGCLAFTLLYLGVLWLAVKSQPDEITTFIVAFLVSCAAVPFGAGMSAVAHYGYRYTALARGFAIGWGILLALLLGLLAMCLINSVGR